MKGVAYDEQTRGRMVALYQSGHSIAQVAKAIGCALQTVRKVLQDHGVERRGHSPQNRVGAPPVTATQPRLTKNPDARRESYGNCVRCKHAIAGPEAYVRVVGVLGKVCLTCTG